MQQQDSCSQGLARLNYSPGLTSNLIFYLSLLVQVFV